MRLYPPALAPMVKLRDLGGRYFVAGAGRPVLLSFFRDADCPFCNLRLIQLTKNYPRLHAKGLEVVAVFASDADKVKRFMAKQPRPFFLVADPALELYKAYGIEHSFAGKVTGILKHFPTFVRGLGETGVRGLVTNNVMPADFLIGPDGRIALAHYGREVDDRLSIDELEEFARRLPGAAS